MVDSSPPGWFPAETDTLEALLTRAFVEHRDKPFMEFEGRWVTYAELDDRVRRFAFGLRSLGLEKGDRVATLLDNSPDGVVAWLATVVLGGIYVPINTAYRSTFLAHQLRDSGAKVLVAEADYVPRVLEIEATGGDLEHLVVRGAAQGDVVAGLAATTFEDQLQLGALDEFVGNHPADVASVIYTGGTTGLSKGCMLSHNMQCSLARLTHGMRAPDEVWWTALPLFHANAALTVLSTISEGAAVCLARRFSVSTFWDDIERSGARIVSLLGSMTTFLADAPDNPAMERCRGQIRRVVAAPFPLDAQRVFRDRFGVAEVGSAGGYGSTEAMPITIGTPDSPAASSGRPTPYYEVIIVDDHDNPVPAGTVGEIACRPKMPHIMFEGYWGNPAATVAVVRNLWYHTGDLGRFDDQGFLYFVDRKKDYLRRRGENISSMEVEAALLTHDDILEVAVFGVPAIGGEDDVQVTVVCREGAVLDGEMLCKWSIDVLPYFAVPRYIEFRRELPRNSVGRVLKQQLRDEAPATDRWDREASDIVVPRR